MFSFLIIVLLYLIPCIYYFVTGIVKYNKVEYKFILAIVLLFIAIYLKSINM